MLILSIILIIVYIIGIFNYIDNIKALKTWINITILILYPIALILALGLTAYLIIKNKVKSNKMKYILSIILIITFASCDNRPTPDSNRNNYQSGFVSDEIRYFKDPRTNKCFAERGVGEEYSFTCIPCDSITEAAITNQYKQQR